jgi:hypothetical protein
MNELKEMKKTISQSIISKGGAKEVVMDVPETPKDKDKDKDINNISVNEIFNFMELYFDRYGVLFGHLYNSFNKFLDEDVVSFLKSGDHTFFEKMTGNKVIKYKFRYDKLSIKPPSMEGDIEPMFPTDARNRNMTYSGKLMANVTQIQEVTDIATLNVIKNQFECLLCSLDFEEKWLACLQSYCDKHISNHDCKGEETWIRGRSSNPIH